MCPSLATPLARQWSGRCHGKMGPRPILVECPPPRPPGTFSRLRASKVAMGPPFSHHSDARQVREMWVVLTCTTLLANEDNLQKEARPSLLTNPHHISAFGKTVSVRQLFLAAWFQLVQVTFLAAVTTGRNLFISPDL